MVVLYIALGMLAVFLIVVVVGVIRLCWLSIPYEDYVRYEKEKAQLIIIKQERKKGRREKWKRLRKRFLSFWRSWRNKA